MHTHDTMWQTTLMEVYRMSTNNKNNRSTSDEQAIRKNLSRSLDHELANEPLTAAERLNNKKTKKRQ